MFGGTHRYDFEETRRGALVFIWVGLAMGAAQFVSVCLFEFTAERQVRSIHPGLPCPHLRPDFFAQSGHDGNLTDTQGYSRVLTGTRGCKRVQFGGPAPLERWIQRGSSVSFRRKACGAGVHPHTRTVQRCGNISNHDGLSTDVCAGTRPCGTGARTSSPCWGR